MAWEKRQNGRKYFYLCRRMPDGRVHKQYLGNGLRAEMESLRLESKAFQKQVDSQLRDRIVELDSMAEDYASSTLLLLEAHLYAAGYHDPKRRGWRKRRSVQMNKSAECENQEQGGSDLEPGEWVSEKVTLDEVVRRCRDGDQDALVTLRRAMKEHPDLFSQRGHIAAKVQTEWVRALTGHDLFEREVMFNRTRELRQGLIEEGTGSHLERLMVDHLVATHLEQGFHGLIEARCVGKGIELPKFEVEASQRAARRHEKALAALTTIRALAPRMESHAELVSEEPTEEKACEQTTSHAYAYAENNRMTAVFDRTRHPVPLN
ncbi:hypothetical protein [Allorhodopirellula heiligendammensis]|uniref:Uncharacterized protein n=1 Tax=Allorhodopirellula heiligendammensis TaxID=2714739 RepID=A0A5C6C459_9BACT|nr:hypothetical protein [Allorhodopirellula heiligendammensis]TWU18875.1 hypothetical protein Poly21_10440 [Allorhodopirellula heiligendammensis]